MHVAKAPGRLRSKQPKLSQAQEKHLVEVFRRGEHTTVQIAELFNVARSTLYRAMQRDGDCAVFLSAGQNGSMARSRIDDGTGRAALAASAPRDRATQALAVRYTLQLLAERFPGNTLEVRVPPFGAVQCVEGPRHTRGTPPNVIETDAHTWLALALGSTAWPEALGTGAVHASGTRANLDDLLPLV